MLRLHIAIAELQSCGKRFGTVTCTRALQSNASLEFGRA